METANYKQLKMIDALIECGNATRAAAKLQVSSATISYTLSQLRKKCEGELFTRSHGKMIPTDIALAMQAKYQEISTLNTEKKELTISTDAIIDFILGQSGLQGDEEGASFSMRFINMGSSEEDRLNKLRNRIVDIDIGSKLPVDSSIVCTKLLESDISVMVSKDHSFIKDTVSREQWFKCGHTRWLGDNAAITSMIEGLDFNDEMFANRVICYESMNLLTLTYVCSRSNHIMLIPSAFIEPLSRFYNVKAVTPPEGIPVKFECYYHYHRSMQARVKSLSLAKAFADK